jgi:hypothetical protein
VKRRLVVLLVAAACLSAPATAAAEPLVARTCNGSTVCNLWFKSPVHVDWTIVSGAWLSGCNDITIDVDTVGSQQGCAATEGGETDSKTVTIMLDQKPPIISGVTPARPPDHAGWYTRPVTFTVQADDATSKLAGCDAPTYGGPDNASATFVATCTDKAGWSVTRTFPLSYDATPPDPSPARLTTGDKVVRLSWPAGANAAVTRTPGTDGSSSAVLYEGPGTGFTDREVRNGRKYRYVLSLTDPAGNSASRELVAKPDRHLVGPAKRATVAGPPRLTWTPVRGARYYNVQLFRNGTKILSKWPRQASLQLKPKWRFHGRRYRLKPGEYRWYVWPGKGPRAENRYGRMVGKRSFTVASS